MLQILGERVVWSPLLERCGMGNSAAQEEKHFQNQFLRYGRIEMFVNLVHYFSLTHYAIRSLVRSTMRNIYFVFKNKKVKLQANRCCEWWSGLFDGEKTAV